MKRLLSYFYLFNCLLLFLSHFAYGQKSLKGISFSHASGYYDSPFDLTITVQNNDASLFYTIDGSNPASSTTRINAGQTAIIHINPDLDSIRPSTPSFIVRTIGMIGDSAVTEHVTGTYIFIENVKKQAYPGGDWPLGNVGEQVIDLNIDPYVINDPDYAEHIHDAFLDVPTISVITDMQNLFSRSTGIYVNAHGHGKAWERPCSIELINPDGQDGFFENAGIRIRGGWSRHPNFAKHAFRLFFRAEYGTDKLRYPLFENEGVHEFDKIDLRCAQNYSWSNHLGEHNTFVREVFGRDTQGAMGQPYTRSRYYHLFLNGMYWGLFQTQERSEARYAASYFGGDKDDYDVVKVNVENYVYDIEATDGNLENWNRIWDMNKFAYFNNKDYFRLEGKNSVGHYVPNSEVLVDIDNLIDYMLLIFYTGSFDAPVTQFRGNDFPNNFYAIDNREDKSTGFKFFAHDLEHSLMIHPVTVGIGINENRVNIGTITGDRQMLTSQKKHFNPQWLHFKLTTNEEYKLRFADRAFLHFENNGVFTEQRALERFDKRAAQIDMAIIAESARWGDTKRSTPYTKHNAWLPELEDIRKNFFPKRPGIVIKQLKQENLYSSIMPPELYVNDTLFNVSEYFLEGGITMEFHNPEGAGEIYYTLDGKDPRLIGGQVNSVANKMPDESTLNFSTSATIKARIKNGDEWSALRVLTLIGTNDDLSHLKITEIHYHPEDHIVNNDTLHDEDLEFLEFKNTGTTALNLSGLRLDSAISYSFPENTILPPGSFWVIASKPSVFYEYYGLPASGNYKRNLSNSGEQVVLFDAQNNILIDFTYDDRAPWFEKADGDGPSLVSTTANPTGDPADPAYWRLSVYHGGTPFRDDELITAAEKSQDFPWNDKIHIYPNPSNGRMNISIPSLDEHANLNIKLFSLQGQLLIEKLVKNHENFVIPKDLLSNGIKVITIEKDGFFATQKIIIED